MADYGADDMTYSHTARGSYNQVTLEKKTVRQNASGENEQQLHF